MAHFYGIVDGQVQKSPATRRGHKARGLQTTAASWEGAVRVELYHEGGRDYARVSLTPWHGQGISRLLFDGLIGAVNGQQNAAPIQKVSPAGGADEA